MYRDYSLRRTELAGAICDVMSLCDELARDGDGREIEEMSEVLRKLFAEYYGHADEAARALRGDIGARLRMRQAAVHGRRRA